MIASRPHLRSLGHYKFNLPFHFFLSFFLFKMSDIYSLPYTNPIDSLILDPIIEPEAISENDLNLWVCVCTMI